MLVIAGNHNNNNLHHLLLLLLFECQTIIISVCVNDNFLFWIFNFNNIHLMFLKKLRWCQIQPHYIWTFIIFINEKHTQALKYQLGCQKKKKIFLLEQKENNENKNEKHFSYLRKRRMTQRVLCEAILGANRHHHHHQWSIWTMMKSRKKTLSTHTHTQVH